MVDHVEEDIPRAQEPVPRKVKCVKNLWKPKGWDPSNLAFSRPNHISHRPLVGLVSVSLGSFAAFCMELAYLALTFVSAGGVCTEGL